MTSAPEFSRVPDAPRSDDLEALRSLSEALAAADYSYDAILDLLGRGPFEAMVREQVVPARHRIHEILSGKVAVKAGQRRLAGVVDFLMLGGEASPESLDATLGEGAYSVLESLRFLAPGRTGLEHARVRAAYDLRPHSADDGTDLWVVSDLGAHQTDGALPTDYVLGVGQASLTLAQFTERSPVRRALDLGTGCGIQVFHLLSHAEHVTATDISARALAMTRFNLVLNASAWGLDPEHLDDRVVLRHGSLLDPVAGEGFDLVVTNPPFVITPRRAGETEAERYTYRDGGLPGDELVAQLVRDIPSVLRPGGRAHLLGNWEIHADADAEDGQAPWDRRPRTWLADGCDAWFIQREETSPEAYAETWLRDASQNRDAGSFESAYLDYIRDFHDRDVAAVGFGMIWLRRRENREPFLRFESIEHPIQQPIAPFFAAAVAAHDLVAGLSDEDLRARHLVVADDVTEERHQRPGAEHPGVILLREGAGLRRTELLSTPAAGFVSACDGDLAVGQIIDALGALLGWEDDAPAAELLGHVRSLVDGGFLVGAGEG
ncbi:MULTISPECIES: methyltransferase [Micrococcales]|uniref:methyltransferase n=1 Tax=Micrococcales TaxID=85006 RepID=UPI0004AB90FA|nr:MULTISPECIES: methyltransferase [Micrococcales]